MPIHDASYLLLIYNIDIVRVGCFLCSDVDESFGAIMEVPVQIFFRDDLSMLAITLTLPDHSQL